MKFSDKIIYESENFEDGGIPDHIFTRLYKDCYVYLNDVKKSNGYWLYRGVGRHSYDFFKNKPRKDRKPTDSSQWWHDALDSALHRKFKVKARSEGLFCKMIYPTGYGFDYIIFPIGKYECIWSGRVVDAYFYEPADGTNDKDLKAHADNIANSYMKGSVVDVAKWIKSGGNLKTEIALICKEYYAIKADSLINGELTRWVRNEI